MIFQVYVFLHLMVEVDGEIGKAFRCMFLTRSFNRDILTVLVGEEEAKAQFDWLSEMPFVVRKPALILKNQTY